MQMPQSGQAGCGTGGQQGFSGWDDVLNLLAPAYAWPPTALARCNGLKLEPHEVEKLKALAEKWLLQLLQRC